MTLIDHYAFGTMRIDGQTHTKDLIVHADGTVQPRWWRASGHRLVPEDIAQVIEAGPRHLVVGTGAHGMMRVDPRVRDACAKRGIDLFAAHTAEAVARYNELVRAGEPVAACFHLTC